MAPEDLATSLQEFACDACVVDAVWLQSTLRLTIRPARAGQREHINRVLRLDWLSRSFPCRGGAELRAATWCRHLACDACVVDAVRLQSTLRLTRRPARAGRQREHINRVLRIDWLSRSFPCRGMGRGVCRILISPPVSAVRHWGPCALNVSSEFSRCGNCTHSSPVFLPALPTSVARTQ